MYRDEPDHGPDCSCLDCCPPPVRCERCAKPGTEDEYLARPSLPLLVVHPEDDSLWFHIPCLALDVAEWAAREAEAREEGRKDAEAN